MLFTDWSIGTDKDSADILPKTKVSHNGTEQSAIVQNATLFVGNVSLARVSELVARSQGKAEDLTDNIFRLEPGRVFYHHLDVCNLASRCVPVDLPAVAVISECNN